MQLATQSLFSDLEHDIKPGVLIVVGTGIGGAGQTTRAARRAIEVADRVHFAVVDPWTVRWIRSLNTNACSLPYPLDDSPRRATYDDMSERILADVRAGLRVCAVFYGHPGVLAAASHDAVHRARSEGYQAYMLPGVSAIDCLFADLGVDPGQTGCQLYEANDFLLRPRQFDIYAALILCQVGLIGNRGFFDAANTGRIQRGLATLSDSLVGRYPCGQEALIYEAALLPTERPRMEWVALTALADVEVSDLTTLYIPAVSGAPIDIETLRRLEIG